MGITVAATRAAVNTATGNQDFTTTALGGLTPKAAYFVVTYATTDGTAANHAMLGIGAATGTANRWAAAVSSEHAAGSSDTYCSGSTTTCVRIISPIDGTVDGEADFVSFITNGVRINWSNAPAAAYLLTVVLFAGTDLSAHANNVALGDTLDNAVDVTAPAFRPDVLLTALIPTIVGEMCWGMVQEDGAGTVSQRSYGFGARDAQNTMNVWSMYRGDAGIFETSIGGGLDWYGEFGGFDANGFTVTTRTAGANSTSLYYLALDLGSTVSAWVGTHVTPTVTGNHAVSTIGFEPQFVLIFPSMAFTDGGALSGTGTARAHSSGVAALMAATQYCATVSDLDDAGTSDTQSLSDDVAIALPAPNGTLDIEATLVSFDSGGYTLNFSNVATELKRWPVLAIEVSAAGYTLTAELGTFTLTGIAATPKAARLLAADQASLTLTGTAAAFVLGKKIAADQATFTLTGQDASLLRAARLTVEAGALPLSGQIANILRGFKLAADAGIFALAGQDAAIATARTLAANSGTYVLTGNDAVLTYGAVGGYTLTADTGTYTVAGQDATLTPARLLAAESASLTADASEAGLLRGYALVAAAGTFTLTGQDAGLAHEAAGAYTLSANAGTFALSAPAVALVTVRQLAADTAALALSGQDAAFLRGQYLGADTGTLTLTGASASLLLTRRLVAELYAFVLSGQATTLIWSGYEAPPTPDTRIWVLPAEPRAWALSAENRTVTVTSESRTETVE